MISQKITVSNPSGLHLRPAGNLCNEAIKYESRIEFLFSGGSANAKSVLSVLGAWKGRNFFIQICTIVMQNERILYITNKSHLRQIKVL